MLDNGDMPGADRRPWYRMPIMWMMIGLPVIAVIAGFITLYLAVSTRDGLVVDDYYAQGKAINLELARDQEALTSGLGADLAITASNNTVDLDLRAVAGFEPPQKLQLSFMHTTRDDNDRVLTAIRRAAWHYSAPLPEFVPGRYRVQVETPSWRLVGSLHVPGETRVALAPVK